jgi:glycerol-3-phosphate acyltransferase PlsX
MILKTIEGTAKFFSAEIKGMFMASLITKIAGLIVKPKINELRAMMDYKEVGGSPIMGIKNPVFRQNESRNQLLLY